MLERLSSFAGLPIMSVLLLHIANETRGIVLAVPVLYGMYLHGGTLMAVWIGICCLSGIALSATVPIFLIKKLKRFQTARC
jgi:hypothetical protein